MREPSHIHRCIKHTRHEGHAHQFTHDAPSDLHNTPITAAAADPAAGDNLILNFSLPAASIYRNKPVASVIIPVRLERHTICLCGVCFFGLSAMLWMGSLFASSRWGKGRETGSMRFVQAGIRLRREIRNSVSCTSTVLLVPSLAMRLTRS